MATYSSSNTAETIAPRRLGFADTIGFVGKVLLPTLGKGVLIRRPAMEKLSAKLELDRKAVRTMQSLRARYGEAPLAVRNPVRPQFIIMAPADLKAVLDGTPDPFTPASDEKISALSHFEPDVSLITRGPLRAPRRALNDEVLHSAEPVHPLAMRMMQIVDEEFGLRTIGALLTWSSFITAWLKTVRRIVLGDSARDRHDVTDLLAALRGNANWGFMARQNVERRTRLHNMLAEYLAAPEPGSLAAMIAAAPHSAAAPTHQMTQWLFPFDSGGIAAYRMLALIATHSEALAQAKSEAAQRGAEMPFLRAAFAESVRLWPTTPVILRQTTRETELNGVSMPAGAGILIFVPFFQRDDQRQAFADRFTPALWTGKDPGDNAPLVPFSGGPAVCPGRHIVSMLGGMTAAALLRRGRLSLVKPPLSDGDPMPGTLDQYALRFQLD